MARSVRIGAAIAAALVGAAFAGGCAASDEAPEKTYSLLAGDGGVEAFFGDDMGETHAAAIASLRELGYRITVINVQGDAGIAEGRGPDGQSLVRIQSIRNGAESTRVRLTMAPALDEDTASEVLDEIETRLAEARRPEEPPAR